ncbi:hypothetical protein [Chryseobacterium rhizosphaerae]|uniref:Lipoprotein n=1 Tax=Chryseobacterium rhizosphaerae TaxID=395937 RepID=A0AAE3YDR1_9FLAO|nr:hypothetical protein [Chryseobacterium rhizosphaerae]MDR6528306.1 hypothetical protein [Chryseobacterium rhizosphaerae]
MKINFLFLHLLLFLCILSCNGQEKSVTLIPAKEDKIKPSLTDNFNKTSNLYFDSEKKLSFSSTLIKELGKFTVYYIPRSKEEIIDYQNFEKNHDIIPLRDEENSLNYFSDADQKKIDKILREKIKSEKGFQIIGTFIPKNFINIENDNEYNISFPYSQKYYQKENGKWKYLFEKKITNAEEEISNNSKNALLSFTIAQKETSDPNVKYSVNGNWQVDCKKGAGSLSIDGNEASLTVLYNQIYIDMKELKRYDFEKGIAYTLKEVPEDIGNIGRGLNWKEYVNNEPIAYLKIIDENTMFFYWYGFYNKTTKQREFKETNFQQESKTKEIILKRCSP